MIGLAEITFLVINRRTFTPPERLFDQAIEAWRQLPSDPDAHFDAVYEINVAGLCPQVTWGTNPGMVTDVTDVVPDPAAEKDPAKRQSHERALQYMGLQPGQKIQD